MQCRIPPRRFMVAPQRLIIFRTFCRFVEFAIKDPANHNFFDKNGFIINPKLKSYKDIRKMIMNFMYKNVIQILPEIQKLVQDEEKKLEWSKYYWIGVQIRSGHMKGDEGLNLFMHKSDLELFLSHAVNQTAKALKKQPKPVKWYIAADSTDIKDEIKKRYGQYYSNIECQIGHSFRDVHTDKRSPSLTCTIVENYILTDTNEAIVTASSTYGLMATYRRLDMKKIMIKRGDWKRFLSNGGLPKEPTKH